MTVNMAVEFFENAPQILPKIKALQDVGLGYIKLGQSSTTSLAVRVSVLSWQPNLQNVTQVRHFTFLMSQLLVFTLKIYVSWWTYYRTCWPWQHRYHHRTQPRCHQTCRLHHWHGTRRWSWWRSHVELWYTRGCGKEQRELHFSLPCKSTKVRHIL